MLSLRPALAVLVVLALSGSARPQGEPAAAGQDPWLAVEDLCREGSIEGARELAGAVPGEPGERLRAYVDWRAEHPASHGAGEALAEARAALGRDDHRAVLAIARDRADGVTGARLLEARGTALRNLRRFAEAGDELLAAAGAAREAGWLEPCPGWLGMATDCFGAGGDFPSAVAAAEVWVEVSRELRDQEVLADALTSLGRAFQDTSEYGRARDVVEEALAIREGRGGPGLRATLLAKAAILLDLGDREGALAIQERALGMAEEAGDDRAMLSALVAIGVTLQRMTEFEKALACHERALAIARRLRSVPGVAACLGNLGVDALGLGDHEASLRYQEEALPLFERSRDHQGAARTLANLALTWNKLGKPDRAIPLWQQGMVRAFSVGSRGMAGFCMWGLAGSHYENGDPVTATKMYRQIVSAGRHLLRGLSFAEVMRARESAAHIFGAAFIAARDAGSIADVGYFVETGRADGLITALGGEEALKAADIPPGLAETESRLRAAEDGARRAYRRAIARGERTEVKGAKERLDQAHAALRDVVEEIERRRRAAVDELFPEPAGLSEIRASLDPTEALVLYGLARQGSLALILTRAGERVVDLGEARRIEEACPALAAAASTGGDVQEPAQTLRKLLVDPLGLDPEIRRIVVSPHGPLAQLTFGLLAGEREVAFTPSGTVHATLAGRRGTRGTEVLALGDPAYDLRGSGEIARTRWGMVLSDLPATRDEAKAVGDVVLLDSEATETAFRKALGAGKRWRAIHFACHGVVDTGDPTQSTLAVTADEENDGFVSVLDVLRLEIPADLVVLSACETAKGKVLWAEGVEGFPRAFLFAGAHRVLVSLWMVDDEATKALMVRFYELWNPEEGEGLPAATALKQAQDFVKSHEKWSHPYYWAAWVLWGLAD